MLADDSEDNRYLIRSYLRRSEAEVDIAEDGETAARMFREGAYDIVLMDVEMPVMDGYQATGEIRRFEKETGASATPVLALTAHAFAEMAGRGLEAGFTALLTKPIRKVTLLEALVEHGRKNAAAKGAGETVTLSGTRPTIGASPLVKTTSGTNLVEVEEGMEDVVPGYLEKRRAEIPVYTDALAREDFDSIKRLAHKMRGTGSGYGFPVLTELGSVLEKAAIAGDSVQIRESVNRFALYLDSIELKYSS